jgi:hypothetical protein
MADLSKILQQESEGIMFPFRTGVQSTTTEQQVYDSATDGIMTVTGQQYSLPEYKGPTATVQYGTKEEGYPRMLRQIEQGELPQFRQEDFPKVGEGVMQPSTPVTQPVEPTPTEPEAPAIDPCPAGFKYDPVQKVCVPIEQPKSDKQEPFVNKPRNIGDTAQALGQITSIIEKEGTGTVGQDVDYKIDNSSILSKLGPIGKIVDKFLIKDPADKKLQKLSGTEGINVTKNEDGTYNVNITEKEGKLNFQRLMTNESLAGNLASTQKTDSQGNIIRAPNGQIMIAGPISMQTFGKVDPEARFEKDTVATPTTTVDKESTAADAEGGAKVKLTGATEPVVFGELPQVKEFGQLVRNNFTAQLEIEAALNAIKQYETLYETGRINFGERDDEIDRQKDRIEKAKKVKEETDKQIEESDLGDNIPRQEYNKNDTAQERRFKEKVEEKRIQNEVKKFQEKQRTQATKPDKARAGERLTLRL